MTDHQHQMGHEIAGRIITTINAYVAEGHEVTLLDAYHGIEIAASLLRRHMKDRGVPKEWVKLIRSTASSCAKKIMAVNGAPLITKDELPPDDKDIPAALRFKAEKIGDDALARIMGKHDDASDSEDI